MTHLCYIVAAIDPDTARVVGVDLFSEAHPTLLPLIRAVVGDCAGRDFNDAHSAAIETLAYNDAYAWALPYLGRCRAEVASTRHATGKTMPPSRVSPDAVVHDPEPTLIVPPPPIAAAKRAALPDTGSWQLVEAVHDHVCDRFAAFVTPVPNGFLMETLRADWTAAEAVYVGAHNVHRMWRVDEATAKTTAARLGSNPHDLPTWAVLAPPPIPEVLAGDMICFDGWPESSKVLSVVENSRTLVVRQPTDKQVIGIDLSDSRHASQLRSIDRNDACVWEREVGMWCRDNDKIPF